MRAFVVGLKAIMLLLAVGCGKKKENPLSFGVSVSSEKAFVFAGVIQPCAAEVDDGGLPNVSGYYYRVANAAFQWASSEEAVVLQKLTMTVSVPGATSHTCTFEGEDLQILFGLDSLIVGPAEETDSCGAGDSLVSSCIERSTLGNGQCSLVCGDLPIDSGTSNFIVPATLELSGVALKGSESRKVSRSKRILVEYSK